MANVKLSKRMKMVADTVTKGSIVADIGCDHAYTSIYMMQEDIAKKVIAMDVNKGPLSKANENIRYYGLSDKIETRLSDGAKKLQQDEVNSIVIAGMGGRLVVKILSDSKDIIDGCNELVLQPQSEIYLVRKYLHDIFFEIVEEKALKEDGKYYFIIKAKKERIDEQYQEYENYYGRYLIKHKDDVLKEYLKKELKVCETILDTLNKQTESKSSIDRRNEIDTKIKYIKEGLKNYDM